MNYQSMYRERKAPTARAKSKDNYVLPRVFWLIACLLFLLMITPTAWPQGADNLDLREANVTGVEFNRTGDSYRFDVTLVHDDDGEQGYANWWQVETLSGERLGRRSLLHPHGTREFTRSETISIPTGVSRVVVRGHDQTHGYGGQAILVNLETAELEVVNQGSDRTDFSRR